ncbi:hypothetical protein [Timonella senegalensis]|uniref:hypothetical protein n=1 Tax=Timonella senegalensis TaxID=1465825 RepID=UPI002FDE914E
MWTTRGLDARLKLEAAGGHLRESIEALRRASADSEAWISPNSQTFREDTWQAVREAELLRQEIQAVTQEVSALFSEIPF